MIDMASTTRAPVSVVWIVSGWIPVALRIADLSWPFSSYFIVPSFSSIDGGNTTNVLWKSHQLVSHHQPRKVYICGAALPHLLHCISEVVAWGLNWTFIILSFTQKLILQGFGVENKGSEALSFRQVYGCLFRFPASQRIKGCLCEVIAWVWKG